MTSLDHVFVFTDRREEVAAFYRDVLRVPVESTAEDATWFGLEDARLVVHDREDQETAAEVSASDRFVIWFGVQDVDAAFERARAAGAVVGERRPHYFFASDPEGRFIGVRAER